MPWMATARVVGEIVGLKLCWAKILEGRGNTLETFFDQLNLLRQAFSCSRGPIFFQCYLYKESSCCLQYVLGKSTLDCACLSLIYCHVFQCCVRKGSFFYWYTFTKNCEVELSRRHLYKCIVEVPYCNDF